MSNQGQKCNRKACDNTNAQWYNHSTKMFYCESCAAKINELNKEEAHELYGHDLCTLKGIRAEDAVHCPLCGNSNMFYTCDWSAVSHDDADNAATLSEYQCCDCQTSFWI